MTRARIGIVSWNVAELLDACLGAIPDAANGLEFEVVVVDNNSADASVDVARRHESVTVIVNGDNVGYARGMNRALTHDLGTGAPDVFIALNPDTVPPPGSLTRLVERLLDDPRVGLVVPRLVNPDGSLQHSVYRFPSPMITFVVCAVPLLLQRGRVARRWWLEGRVPHDEPCDIDWAIGAVHVMRVEAIRADRPYREQWFMYVEDLDLCWQLRKEGWRVRLEPEVQVTHVGNASGRQAWGDRRTQRWWVATYDWYRSRRGAFAAWRFAATNTLGVAFLLMRARVRRRVLTDRSGGTTARIDELRQILPHHWAMVRAPRTAFAGSESIPPDDPT
ncbi:MAG TPA: glycosyltransferase family 2 protein [Acidimicrobiales bacterium]|jgi:hypothetical protein